MHKTHIAHSLHSRPQTSHCPGQLSRPWIATSLLWRSARIVANSRFASLFRAQKSRAERKPAQTRGGGASSTRKLGASLAQGSKKKRFLKNTSSLFPPRFHQWTPWLWNKLTPPQMPGVGRGERWGCTWAPQPRNRWNGSKLPLPPPHPPTAAWLSASAPPPPPGLSSAHCISFASQLVWARGVVHCFLLQKKSGSNFSHIYVISGRKGGGGTRCTLPLIGHLVSWMEIGGKPSKLNIYFSTTNGTRGGPRKLASA